jgi:hypothetical protein
MAFPDDLYLRGVAPYAVVEAIQSAFPMHADEILASLRYHPGDGFWSFTRWGMFVGVERDGHVHT